MAGPGLGLLNRLIAERLSLSALDGFGIGIGDLVDDEVKVFSAIREHVESFGSTPRVETIEVETGVRLRGFPDEPMEYWADRVRRRNKRRTILDGMDAIRKSLQNDDGMDDAHRQVQALASELSSSNPVDRVRRLAAVTGEVLVQHNVRQKAGEMLGVPFGLEYLDMVSDGAQPGDTIALVGRPEVGKSYLLFRLALNAWETNRVPMVLSMEMSPLQVARRILALKSKVSATKIRLGRLSVWGKREIEKATEAIGRGVSFYLLQGSLHSTVEDLVAKVQEYRPSALYVDGAYMLNTRSKTAARWERVGAAAETLKILATEFGIPVICTYQFNRRGPGSLGNIAYSDMVGQLASIVISIDDDDEDSSRYFRVKQSKILQLIKGREGEKGTIKVAFDFERMKMEQIEVISGYDDRML